MRRTATQAAAAMALTLALGACVGPAVVVMKNPTTGEVVQCKGAAMGYSLVADSMAARDCATGYLAAGWTRMN